MRNMLISVFALSFVGASACAQSRGDAAPRGRSATPAEALPSVDDPVPAPPEAAEDEAPTPRAGDRMCGDEACEQGQTCVRYYGVAGPSGPLLESCEWTCEGDAPVCPEGMKCVTIADGPGRVCR